MFVNECIYSMSLESPTWYEFVIRLNKNLKVIGNISFRRFGDHPNRLAMMTCYLLPNEKCTLKRATMHL